METTSEWAYSSGKRPDNEWTISASKEEAIREAKKTGGRIGRVIYETSYMKRLASEYFTAEDAIDDLNNRAVHDLDYGFEFKSEATQELEEFMKAWIGKNLIPPKFVVNPKSIEFVAKCKEEVAVPEMAELIVVDFRQKLRTR